jgi:hypothetical protein
MVFPKKVQTIVRNITRRKNMTTLDYGQAYYCRARALEVSDPAQAPTLTLSSKLSYSYRNKIAHHYDYYLFLGFVFRSDET